MLTESVSDDVFCFCTVLYSAHLECFISCCTTWTDSLILAWIDKTSCYVTGQDSLRTYATCDCCIFHNCITVVVSVDKVVDLNVSKDLYE